MGLQYDNPNPHEPDPLRTQRMTADEAKSVIALWQQERVEQTGLTDRPAVPDVAEGLDVPVEEVQHLLAEVRARRAEKEAALAAEDRELSEVQRRRTHWQRKIVPRSRWVEIEPGVWEDINQQAPPALSLRARVGVVIICLILSTAVSVLACLVWILSSVGRN